MSGARPSVADFDIISALGGNHTAKFMLAEYKHSKKLYAIKIHKKKPLIDNDETNLAAKEKRILRLGNEEQHPFIVHLFATFQTEHSLYLVTEYVPGGDLMWHIDQGAFSQQRAQ